MVGCYLWCYKLRVKSPGMFDLIVFDAGSLYSGQLALCGLGHLCKVCIGVNG